ncbi:MAG: hypothetical protein J6X21_07865 [Bacteroidaceae bacterium]|nr:hypothetical protein [Bacteroidaceae bacterium]
MCCLAIGTTMFATLFYGLNHEYYEYNRRPLYDRSAIAYEDIPDDENYSVNRGLVRKGIRMPISFEMMAKLDLPEIEYVSGECQGDVPANFEVSDSERVYLNGAVRGKEVCGDYFKFHNLTLLYGDRVPQNSNEIVVTESFLRKIGYDKDISQCRIKESHRNMDYVIVNVVKDDVWSRYVNQEIFFMLDRYALSVLINPNSITCNVVLRKGADINEVNRQLSTSYIQENNRYVVQLYHYDHWPDDPLLSILSIIVLVVAAANFFKHTVMLLRQRGRANIIRYSLGAGSGSLSVMMLTEMLTVLLVSLAIALYLSFHVCAWLNSAAEFLGYIYFNYTDVAVLDMAGIVMVGITGAVVCRISAVRQNRLLRQRIVAQRGGSKMIKYIVIGLETIVAVCALSVALYTWMNVPRPYNPLPSQVSRRVFYVNHEEGENVAEYYKKLQQLPEVDEVIPTDGSWNDYPGFTQIKSGNSMWHFSVLGNDINYFRFFDIPVEWFDPVPPSSGFLLDRKSYEELQRTGVDIESLEYADNNHLDKKIHVSGVFDHRICEDLTGYSERVNSKQTIGTPVTVYIAFRYWEHTDAYPREFFIKFNNSLSPAQCESIIRDEWAKVYPMSSGGPEIKRLPEYVDDELKYRVLAFNLGSIVCILLVILSVSSSISADTGMRRKEVALRKVNGAKAQDIMALFIKPYCVILLLAAVIGNLAAVVLIKKSDIGFGGDFLLISLVSLILMALIIMLSIWRRIRTIMHTNPADVIKSE